MGVIKTNIDGAFFEVQEGRGKVKEVKTTVKRR